MLSEPVRLRRLPGHPWRRDRGPSEFKLATTRGAPVRHTLPLERKGKPPLHLIQCWVSAMVNPSTQTTRKELLADQSSHRASLDELNEAAAAGWAGLPGAGLNP